jgi:predicted nucleic acid-binding protein
MVKGLIITQRARLCGLVLAEFLSGVKAKEDREALERTLEALAYLEVSKLTWTLTSEMSAELKVQEIRIPLTDLVVAALAILAVYNVQAAVYTVGLEPYLALHSDYGSL